MTNIKPGNYEKIKNDSYLYEDTYIFIDGELVHSLVNNQPMTFENVNGIIGNTYGDRNYPAADGKYRNFTFKTTGK